MKTITKVRASDFCARAANEKYITIDTEFLRERTYFQIMFSTISFPGDENAVIVDTLVNNLD